jgi:DNA-binding beta-propeller fold protein YncE
MTTFEQQTAVVPMARHLTIPFAQGASTLTLPWKTSNATQAQVDTYDFSDYRLQYDQDPLPRYILVVLQDVTFPIQVTVSYRVNNTTATDSIILQVPADTLAYTSFALDLKGHTEAELRIQRISMEPPAPDGDATRWWSISALLGNLAKLLWVLGWERDHFRRHLELVQQQRSLTTASGNSLDLIGYDLGVARFPPQPYSFEPATIALYHLDDRATSTDQEVSVVEDSMGRYPGKNNHAGTNNKAVSGAVGRFGMAFAFDETAEIVIPAHPDFNFAATDSFTIECFVMPEDNDVVGDILAKSANPADTTKAGWALSIGVPERGLPLNARFAVSDGTQFVTLFTDQSLITNGFSHLAGVIDRQAGQARLYLDGQLHSSQALGKLGAIVNTEPVRIGRASATGYRGVIDEVRISRAARSTFHPVLGEDDTVYRRRLQLFEQWTLPTSTNLLNMLNKAAASIGGGINGDAQPLILSDANVTLLNGSLTMNIEPQSLEPGACMDIQGNKRVREAAVSGTADAETTFDPLFLVTHKDTNRVSYAPSPQRTRRAGEAAPDTHKMQLVTQHALDRLLDVLSADNQLQGVQLQILSAFDPRAEDLRAVGRGLLLSLTSISKGQLAAQAHRAGFDFVCYRTDVNAVYASCAPGDYFEITGAPLSTQEFSLRVKDSVTLGIQPQLPVDTLYRWSIIATGAGRARLASGENGKRSTLNLTATMPGILNVNVEITVRQKVLSVTRALRIGPLDLDDGLSIADDGTTKVNEDSAGPTGEPLPTYLVTHNNPSINYGNVLNNHRMQRSVAQRLDQLAALAGAGLQVIQAHQPTVSGLPSEGRALVLGHSTLAPGTLAMLAHAVGFSYVKRQGNQIQVLQAEGEQVAVTGPPEAFEGQRVELTVLPQAQPQGIVVGSKAIYTANSGTDTVSEISTEVNSTTLKAVRAFKVGWFPSAVVLSPNEQRLYTADNLSNTVTIVDVASGNTVGIPVSVQRNPIALACHPTTGHVYVLCQGDSSLQEIDPTTPAIVNTRNLGGTPSGMALTPDGQALWVTVNTAAQNQVIVINTNALAAASPPIVLTRQPLGITIAPDGKRAYVTQPADGSIAVLDVAGRSVVNASVPVDVNITNTSPQAVTVLPDNLTVYVTTRATPVYQQEQLYRLQPSDANWQNVSRASIRARSQPVAVTTWTITDPTDNTKKKTYVVVANRGSSELGVVEEVVLKNTIELGVANRWQLGSGLGESLNLVLRSDPVARAHFNTTTAPHAFLFAERAGQVSIRAVYSVPEKGRTAPYTFEVRLKPTLEDAGAIIRKEQYDFIMNILNAFHPIGVEVLTRAIREHVIEVRDHLLDAFPDYTYPNFRVRGPLPRRAREE